MFLQSSKYFSIFKYSPLASELRIAQGLFLYVIPIMRFDIQHVFFCEKCLIFPAVNFKSFIQKLEILSTILAGHLSLISCSLRFLEKHITFATNAISI